VWIPIRENEGLILFSIGRGTVPPSPKGAKGFFLSAVKFIWKGSLENPPDPLFKGEMEGGHFKNMERYTDNRDGTISDTRTGLMWEEGYAYNETGNYVDWYDANDYIDRLNEKQLGGHTDWRLPDKLELQSLYELGLAFESRGRTFLLHIDPVFEIGYGSGFWTWRSRLAGAQAFQFDTGDRYWYPKASASATVRAVRLNMNPFKLIRNGQENPEGE